MSEETDRQAQELELGIAASADDLHSSLAEGENEKGDKAKGSSTDKTGTETLTPEEQKERTAFGRGVTKRLGEMEQNFADRFAKTEETLFRFEQVLTRLAPPERDTPDEDVDEAEYERYRKLRARESREQLGYEQGYRQGIDKIKEKDATLHKEIFDEMFKNFNEKHTNNPAVDARLNYAEAKASLMAKKFASAGKPGGERKGSLAPTGISITSKTGEAVDSDIILPPDAEAYIKSQGKDAAFVKRALTEK